MRRWHEERELMIRRWRMEIAKHAYPSWGHYGLAPVPPESHDPDDCHCFRGMGVLRKKAPYDCGRPNCGVCHTKHGVYRAEKRRERAAALAREWEDSGGWG